MRGGPRNPIPLPRGRASEMPAAGDGSTEASAAATGAAGSAPLTSDRGSVMSGAPAHPRAKEARPVSGAVAIAIVVSLLIGGAVGLFAGWVLGQRTATGAAASAEKHLKSRVDALVVERDRLQARLERRGTAPAEAGAAAGPEEHPAESPAAPSEEAVRRPVAAAGQPGAPKSDTAPAPDTPATARTDTEAGGGPGDGARPPALAAPDGGRADDLKELDGIGPKLERTLNDNGIFHFRQLAALSADQVAWLDRTLDLRGRITRDDWVGQARKRIGG